jgi:hypothetical protein
VGANIKWGIVALAIVGAVVLIALDKMTNEAGLAFIVGIGAVIGIPKAVQSMKKKNAEK